MAKIIQYAVITATEEELQNDGLRTLHPKQRVIVETLLLNAKICIVRTSEFTKSFYVMSKSQLSLIENQQLTIQFE